MSASKISIQEFLGLAVSALAGIIVAAILSPKNIYFAYDFLVFLCPLAVIAGILLAIGSRPAFVTGTAIALTVFLALYGAFVLPGTRVNQFAWLAYIMSIPGAGVGALVGDQIVRARKPERAVIYAGIGALTTFIGLVINRMLVCITVMSCRI